MAKGPAPLTALGEKIHIPRFVEVNGNAGSALDLSHSVSKAK